LNNVLNIVVKILAEKREDGELYLISEVTNPTYWRVPAQGRIRGMHQL